MLKLGFHERLINLVMKCVQSASFSVLINGALSGHIIPFRGLRQGDLISPYLFLLYTEGLISLLRKAANSNSIPGIRVCRATPSLNHPLFANDNLIFCTATIETSCRLLNLLKCYGDALGQLINRDKTVMVFSKNTEATKKRDIMELWGNSQTQHYDKYLGLPPLIGKSKLTAFAKIKHKVWLKLQGWKGNIFLKGEGRCCSKQWL